MTDTTEAGTASRSASTALRGMNVAELKSLASGLGITGTTKMRKDDLVAAISAHQGAGASNGAGSARAPRRAAAATGAPAAPMEQPQLPDSSAGAGPARQPERAERRDTAERPSSGERSDGGERSERTDGSDRADGGERPERPWQRERRERRERQAAARAAAGDSGESSDGADGGDRGGEQSRQQGQPRQGQQNQGQGSQGQQNQNQQNQGQGNQGQGNQGYGQQGQQSRWDDGDDSRSGRRRNRQRNRDRKRGRGPGGMGGQEPGEQELQISEDDVLVPVAGILDVLDNYAFVRTSGYLPGPNDVYVPLGLVRRHGLRKGDAVTGAVKAAREGEQSQQQVGNRGKFNPLVRLDTVNAQSPEQARNRVEFGKLTPLYPQERLRLETAPNVLTTRIIDLVSPIGKGQRGLIVSPPKAGKTLILQAVANAITENNPEVHLMVVLVDERPEEVTDMQRTVRGEVIASTFDRPADDHTTIAELAIERAKRLVELGHDVVVLLDSITRLGRAYNLAAPASGRILSGGVDSAALYPPKRFFGAARNIENGGSLTILATALVETGSKMDEVIFEEFKGTGNMELKLSRELANRRIFPAVDVNASGTRREEILMGAEELKIMWKLRRVLSALDPQQSIELLLDRLKKTKGNVEFLVQVQRTSSIKLDDDNDD